MQYRRRSSTRLIHGFIIAFVATGLVACSAFDDDPDSQASAGGLQGSDDGEDDDAEADQTDETFPGSGEVCGREAVPSPAVLPGDPCDHGDLVVDETVRRTAGQPDRETESFQIEAASEVCVTVTNRAGSTDGQGGQGRVSSARVKLDGEQVFGPDQFGQGADQLRKRIEVGAGEHELDVRVASKPGAELDVAVKAAKTPETDQPTTTGDNGLVTVQNVAVDHPMFSPDGDGYHDTVWFNAGHVPDDLGEEGDYRLEYTWNVIDVEDCEEVDVDLSGSTPLDGETNVRTHWEGKDSSELRIPGGKYLYEYEVDLVDGEGSVVDSATATARGLLVKSAPGDPGALQSAGECDPEADPYDCKCPPDEELPEGTRCTFGWIPELASFEEPEQVDTSDFVMTHTDEETGRTAVLVDLREYNAGGLVPQHDGTYDSLEELQGYVAELTGVQPDPEQVRLFNFDYMQLGYSTPVVREEGIVQGFNHFLLDVVTDPDGMVTIDGETVDVRAMLGSSETKVPEGYQIHDPREGEECAENGNTDGDHSIEAESCTSIGTVNFDPEGTGLGVYAVNWEIFDVVIDDRGTVRDQHCIINGIFKCGGRTFHRDADLVAAGDEFVEDDDETVSLAREVERIGDQTTSLVVHTDRQFVDQQEVTPIDGVCSKSMASANDMSAPLDSAAGAVSDECIINGIF